MKRLFYIIGVAMVFVSCSEDFDKASGLEPSLNSKSPSTLKSLSVSNNEFSMKASGDSEVSLTINSDHSPWKIENTNDWITLSEAQGNSDAQVNIKVADNTWSDSREGTITVKSSVSDWQYEIPVKITQEGAEPYINCSSEVFNISARKSNLSFAVNANCKWVLSDDDLRNYSWIHATYDSDSIYIDVDGNDSGKYRRGEVYVAKIDDNSVNNSFVIYQAEPTITADKNDVTVSSEGGTVEITIDADATWFSANLDSDWLSLTPEKGNEGKTSITFSVGRSVYGNKRIGEVILYIGDKQCIYLHIIQEARE